MDIMGIRWEKEGGGELQAHWAKPSQEMREAKMGNSQQHGFVGMFVDI